MKTKTFDCVGMKREAQEKIRDAVRGLSPEQEIQFFRAGAEDFERRVQAAKEALARDRDAERHEAT